MSFREVQSSAFRICIITPGHVSSTPRVVKEAGALGALNGTVKVISTRVLESLDESDMSLVRHASWQSERADFRTRRSRIRHRLTQKIAESGYSVLNSQRLARAAVGWTSSGLTSLARRTQADLYIAHYPSALPAAAIAARCHGGLYAYDAEDFHLGDHPTTAEFSNQRRLTRAIEERYLAGAAYVTASSPDIADAYAAAYGLDRPTTLLNVFPRDEAPPAASARGWTKPGPSLYWFSQTIGPDRGIEVVVAAMAIARSQPHFFVRGQFADGYEAQLDELAQSKGCRERLHFLPSAPPDEMVKLAAAYDVGLASEIGHTPNNRLALSNKLFTYLLAGIPVLVSDTPAQARFAAGKKDCLFVYRRNEAASLAAAIDDWLLSPGRLERARRAAFDLGQSTYNWDVEQETFLNCVRKALASRERAN